MNGLLINTDIILSFFIVKPDYLLNFVFISLAYLVKKINKITGYNYHAIMFFDLKNLGKVVI